MQVAIIQIGNSKGLRLPKSVLDRYSITEKVELEFESGRIIITPVSEVRKGWASGFKRMHESGEDTLIIQDIFEDELPEEWL